MDLVSIVLVLILVGVLLWVVESIIPLDTAVKRLIRVVILIAVVLWLFQAFGLFHGSGPLIR
jgi:CBS domain containing-hemolysin-like protein